jgi:hypothetical protein
LVWVAGRAAIKKGCRVLISAANPRDFNALRNAHCKRGQG